jgi:hypothetical protein
MMSPEERLRKIYAEATSTGMVDYCTMQQLERIAELSKPSDQ